MAVNLSPIWGAGAQLLDNSGNVLTGGKIYTYAAGTSTPAATFTSNTGATANSNPIILNSAGRVPYEIWLTINSSYKFVLKDANDTLIGTWDNISGINDFSSLIPIIFNSEGNGSTVIFNLVSSPYSENTTDVYIQGVYQQKNTYSVSGSILTFSEAPPVNSLIEVSYI